MAEGTCGFKERRGKVGRGPCGDLTFSGLLDTNLQSGSLEEFCRESFFPFKE